MKRIIKTFFVFACFWANAQTTDLATEKKIQGLIQKMTLKEKVSLLHGNSKFYVESIKRLGIPEWALSDGPHGVRAEMNRHNWQYAGWTNDAVTCFPPGTAMAATWNLELTKQRGFVLGNEARARKKDVLLGPGVNIIRTPLGGRNFEYLSEDPFLNGKMAVAYIQALQSKDVASSVKHFLANNQEQDRFAVDVTMSNRALHEIYLPAFKAAIQEGNALTVMGAYNKFRGEFCTESNYLTRTLLREQLGFNGVYMSDWDAVHSTQKAALGSLDLEMGTNKDNYNDWFFANPLIEAVNNGSVPVTVVNEKVANILRVMFKTKVIGDTKNRNKGAMNTKENQQIAYQSAVESIILLQNNKQLLPLDINKTKSIAVIGDNATRKQCNGGFSSEIKALYEITPLEAIQNKWGKSCNILFEQGYNKQSFVGEGNNKGQLNTDFVDWKLIDQAVASAKKADVAIVFAGLNHDFDSETFDKIHMRLPYGQDVLIQEVTKANPNTIVVVIAGSPVDLSAIKDRVPSIVWAGYGGMEAGNAVADVLSGTQFPSGKLPFSIPVNLNQSPAHALGNYPGRDLKVNYEEDILVGYRWFDTKNIATLFPFGFGLSYTQFALEDIQTNQTNFGKDDIIKVTLTVKNTGNKEGAEVVQIYTSQKNPSEYRPVKELKAFEKVFLKPNQQKSITLNIKASDLAFFSEKSNQWTLEKDQYQIHVATSANQIQKSIPIQIN